MTTSLFRNITDADLFAILAESKKKSKPDPANEKQKLLTDVKNKLNSVSFKSINQRLASSLKPNFQTAASSILKWIDMSGSPKKVQKIQMRILFKKLNFNFNKILSLRSHLASRPLT